MIRQTPLVLLMLVLLMLFAPAAQSQIRLYVDASEAPRRLIHARMIIPARPGPLTLVYPKWIPGEHGPTGPVVNVAGQWFKAAGKTLPWRRDSADMYAWHLDIPAGATEVEASLDYLGSASTEGFSGNASATSQLTAISWNQLLLYPQGAKSDDVQFTATIKLPAGWKYATSLPLA